MSIITIRLPDEVLKEIDHFAKMSHQPRTAYIRHAIEYFNAKIAKQEKAKKIKKASFLVRENSMRINMDFDEIEHDLEN